MAIIETRVSDLSGEENDIVTVTFALLDDAYELDVTENEWAELQTLLQPYITVARPAITRRTRRTRQNKTTRATDTPSAVSGRIIKAWLKENGYEVPARGPVSKEQRAAYEAAHTE